MKSMRFAILTLLMACSSAQKVTETGPNADLMRAAAEGNPSAIEAAIVAGANTKQRDAQGRTALHLAVISRNADAIKPLLLPNSVVAEKKARREGVVILPFVNSTGSKNYAWIGPSLPDAIQGLMAENFDFKRKADAEKAKAAVVIEGSYVLEPGGKQALISTTVRTTIDNEILVESRVSAPLDTNIFDALGKVAQEIVNGLKQYTSQEFAIRLKNSEQILISDVNARDRGDLTALSLAGEAKDGAIAEMLIKAGADCGADLIEAINFGNDGAAEVIARYCPDVNYRIAGGKTPLIQAAFKGRNGVTRVLLSRKASPNLQDLSGFTAMNYAAQEGHTEVVRLLLQAQANANIKSWDGLSPLEAARRKNRVEIVEMLGRTGAK